MDDEHPDPPIVASIPAEQEIASHWIKLHEALARTLVVKEAEFGVWDQHRNTRLALENRTQFRAPSQAELTDLLHRKPDVTVDRGRHREIRPKVIERPGVTWLGKDPVHGGKPKRPPRAPLSLAEVALVDAHLHLIGLLQSGALTARSRKRTERIGGADPVTEQPSAIPLDVWRPEPLTRRKRGDLRLFGPIPDYANNRLVPVIDVRARSSTEFTVIEVDTVQFESCLPDKSQPGEVTGGTFRLVGGRSKVVLEVECAGSRALLVPTKGLGAIGVLLSRGGEAIGWQQLDGAATAFVSGRTAEEAFHEGGADPLMPGRRLFTAPAPAPRFKNEVSVGGTSDEDAENTSDSETNDWAFVETEQSLKEFDSVTNGDAVTSDVDPAEIRRFEKLSRERRALASRESGLRRSNLLKEADQIDKVVRQLNNDLKRTLGSIDKYRMIMYHLLEQAIARLASVCPPLARHLGTLHDPDVRALRTRQGDGAIMYCPDRNVEWKTDPVGALSDKIKSRDGRESK